eukprot:gene5985-6681_t
MDIFSFANQLDSKYWEKKNYPQDNIQEKGYKEYHVTRSNIEGSSLTYYLSTDAGDVKVATLHGLSGNRDPLREVNKCYFLIEEAANEETEETRSPGLIKGIAVDDDCVELRR